MLCDEYNNPVTCMTLHNQKPLVKQQRQHAAINSKASQQSHSSVTYDGPGMFHAAYGRSTARAGLPAHPEDSGLHPGG